MSIYDIDGNILNAAYDVDGNQLPQAYDIDGNELIINPDQVPLAIMTYNVQWFTGINSQQHMQNVIISSNNADFIGFQEFSRDGQIPTVGEYALTAYPYRQMSEHYNYNFVASKYALSDVVVADYTARGTEARSYIKSRITKYGKTVTIFNTHLDTNINVRKLQMEELFALAEQEDYCIIIGDFNNVAQTVSDADYINLYKPYVDAGYNIANCNPVIGFVKTWGDSTTATSTAQLTDPTDNIIVSGNINIDSVVFDPTKFSYLNGSPIDHIPVIAHVTINTDN